jgi:hypothetical protein
VSHSSFFALQLAARLVWPSVTAGALFVAFAQCFYTLLQLDCSEVATRPAACTIRDGYRIVYMLIRGASLVDPTGRERLSTETVALLSLFLVIFAIFALALLVTVIVASSQIDYDHIAVKSYWEPKLAFALCAQDFGLVKRGESVGLKGFDTRKSQLWDFFVSAMRGEEPEKGNVWFLRHQPCKFLRCIPAIVILPIWVMCGAVSGGLLWPPQLRIWLFSPRHFRGKPMVEQSGSGLIDIRNDIAQMKNMTHDRSTQVEEALLELRGLLTFAMRE